MGFDVPMTTKGCISFSDMDASMGLPSQVSAPPPVAQSVPPVQMTQAQTVSPVQMPQQQAPPKVRPAATGVILKKGQKVNLTPNGEVLTNIRIALGWDLVNIACDLDTSAFMLGADNKVIGDDWFVFYGQLTSPDGAVVHHGDSDGTATVGGDDESVDIDLRRLNTSVKKIVFVVTINEALKNGHNFSMVKDAYVRAINMQNNKELVRFNLTDYYSNVCSMVVGELYNHNGQWKFNAVGNGLAQDLAGLCATYGVNVAG